MNIHNKKIKNQEFLYNIQRNIKIYKIIYKIDKWKYKIYNNLIIKTFKMLNKYTIKN